MTDLNTWLSQQEWYDNHTLETILACQRKAYLHKIYRGGLAAGVGHGAYAGSCLHAGHAVYYKLWGQDENKRRLAAFRAISREHARRFGASETIEKKHLVENLIDIADSYFDQYLIEDKQYRPIESELACAFPIRPEPGDPVEFTVPFIYVIRLDGLWERLSDETWFVQELKSTSGGVERELTRLAINRQSTGYVYGIRQWPEGRRVKGVIASVMGVFVGKRECAREVYYKSDPVLDSWRRQTINLVEDWRRKAAQSLADGEDEVRAMDRYIQNDKHCTAYGLCPFHSVCYHGLAMAKNIPNNTWTPFEVVEDFTT